MEDVVLVMEGCARVQTPLIRMSQSSLLAAVSAFPVAVLLLHVYFHFHFLIDRVMSMKHIETDFISETNEQ